MNSVLVSGLIYDVTKSYDIAFYASGIPPITGALLIFFMPTSVQVSVKLTSLLSTSCVRVIFNP